jgi:hypothetical protein
MTALRVMQEKGPNARDYYPQGDGVIRVAVAEHCARLAKLESVREELNEIRLAVAGFEREQGR